MSDSVSQELDAIYEAEKSLAEHIRNTIITDIEAGKFSKYELAGRLGRSHIGVDAMRSRKVWTLRYAISIAHRLGYSLSRLEVSLDDYCY